MPSILIEIGYITNLEEEKQLLSASYMEKFTQKLADILVRTYQVEQQEIKKQNQQIMQKLDQNKQQTNTNINMVINNKKVDIKVNNKSTIKQENKKKL